MSRVDLKIVLLGKEYGGKTSLVERYLHDRFLGHVPYQSTIGAAFGGKKIEINGKPLTLGIWLDSSHTHSCHSDDILLILTLGEDGVKTTVFMICQGKGPIHDKDTAGSERYESMSRIYYRGAKAAIVCYDLTDVTSFERAKFWVKELKKNEESCRIYLCGTKKDIVDDEKNLRQVDYHMTTDYADEINAEVFETSSKTGENIRELFLKIATDFLLTSKDTADTNSRLHIEEEHRSTKCC